MEGNHGGKFCSGKYSFEKPSRHQLFLAREPKRGELGEPKKTEGLADAHSLGAFAA
jgi:hypothetical protein